MSVYLLVACDNIMNLLLAPPASDAQINQLLVAYQNQSQTSVLCTKGQSQ